MSYLSGKIIQQGRSFSNGILDLLWRDTPCNKQSVSLAVQQPRKAPQLCSQTRKKIDQREAHLHPWVSFVHEFKQLVDNRLQKLPVSAQEAGVLTNHIPAQVRRLCIELWFRRCTEGPLDRKHVPELCIRVECAAGVCWTVECLVSNLLILFPFSLSLLALCSPALDQVDWTT
jgi:hypothetical protein